MVQLQFAFQNSWMACPPIQFNSNLRYKKARPFMTGPELSSQLLIDMLAWSFWRTLQHTSTSMTWDDRLMYDWVHAIAPFAAQACACQFDKDWAKAWMFVANRPAISHLAGSCPHPSGTHEPIVGVRLPDGTFKSRITAEYPAQLAQALASIIRPFLTTGHPVLHVTDWQTILPKQLSWPDPPGRIEDGGGLPSTALHMIPQRHDKLASLRSRWFKRLSDSRQCLKITAALLSGCKEPPLSESELMPYIDDMLEILDCPPGDFLLDISPGQPFRLKLWYRLATFLRDPDADFLLQLQRGCVWESISH